LLPQAEEDIKQRSSSSAIPQQPNFFQRLFGASKPPAQAGASKPLKMTSSRIVAELVCHDVSEFHHPGFAPEGVNP
jgi:hypothetical protein